MYSSRLFQDLESWTKALISMQRIISLAVKMVDYSEKKVLYVSKRMLFTENSYLIFNI
jgi:hypothetical protein